MELLEQIIALTEYGAAMAPEQLSQLTGGFTVQQFDKGSSLARQGEPGAHEYLLLEGRAWSSVTDEEGREVCLSLNLGPSVLTPHMARTSDGKSLVHIQFLDDARVAGIRADQLMNLMVNHAGIREWGNAIMRDELTRKVGREWCLAALNASMRLDWFRTHYAGYEDKFPHAMIASFLGMTPVTLSRVRNR